MHFSGPPLSFFTIKIKILSKRENDVILDHVIFILQCLKEAALRSSSVKLEVAPLLTCFVYSPTSLSPLNTDSRAHPGGFPESFQDKRDVTAVCSPPLMAQNYSLIYSTNNTR